MIGKPIEKKLSAEMQTYFDRITNSILGKDEELMKVNMKHKKEISVFKIVELVETTLCDLVF